MAKPSNYDELYPGRFLKAGLFKGKKPTLTITDIEHEELEGSDAKKQIKVIISFGETKMKLVACKTNGICLRDMFGKDLANWMGKKVTFFASTWNGEECIRVWGSPDIASEMKLTVTLPRRKPFPMTMHVTKVGAAATAKPAAAPDPQVLAGWDALGWTPEEGAADFAQFTGQPAEYAAHLSKLVDEANAVSVGID